MNDDFICEEGVDVMTGVVYSEQSVAWLVFTGSVFPLPNKIKEKDE